MKMQRLYKGKWIGRALFSQIEISEISEMEMLQGLDGCLYVGTLHACKKYFEEKTQDGGAPEKWGFEMQKLCGVYLDAWGMPRKFQLLKQEIQKGVGERYLYIGTRRKCNEFQKQWWHERDMADEAKKIKFFYNENNAREVWDENGTKYPIYRGQADAEVFVNTTEVDVSHWKSIKHLNEKIK